LCQIWEDFEVGSYRNKYNSRNNNDCSDHIHNDVNSDHIHNDEGRNYDNCGVEAMPYGCPNYFATSE
jgi:hypothetical protein